MGPVFDTLLAALAPTEALGDLWEIRFGVDDDSLQRPWIPDDRVLRPHTPPERGSLPAVLLSLLRLLTVDAEAVVLVGAGDHDPDEVLGAIARVVAKPGELALLRPKAPTFADGFGFVCEARVLFGILRQAVPSWTSMLCEAAFDDDDELDALLRCLPRADVEPVIRRAVLRPTIPVEPTRRRLATPDRVGLA